MNSTNTLPMGCGCANRGVTPHHERSIFEPIKALSDSSWLELSPIEVRQMAKEKLKELEPEAAKLRMRIKANFKEASRNTNSIDSWLVYDYPSEFHLVPQLLDLERQVKRFSWLLQQHKGKESIITDADIERARQASLEATIGLELRPAGGGKQKGLCPFHVERTPSFIVFPDNHYHCFSCGEHGNPIDFLMKKEQLTFQEAVIRLRGGR